MKHTKTLKAVIAMMLTLAIALSGATFDSMTAEAKVVGYQKDRTDMEDADDLNGTTITMKIGDTKKIDLREAYGSNNKKMDMTKYYAWSSSDESIVSMQREWRVSEVVELSYVIIKAEKPGTAVITAQNDHRNITVSFTVTVEQPKVTTKQKKCRHSWKTTKKATCLESGMKTCKKCKLQKVIAKKEHTIETTEKDKNDYTYYVVYQCGACINEDPEIREQHTLDNWLCEDWCEAEFSQLDYGSAKAALEACDKHKEECRHWTGVTRYIQVPYEKKTSTHDVTICTSCGYSSVELDLIFNVNDPNMRMTERDLRNAIYGTDD